MIRKAFPAIKAFSTLAVGMAFFILGCQPKVIVKEIPSVVELPPSPPEVKEYAPELFDMAERDFYSGDYDNALVKYELFLKHNPRGEKSRKTLYQMAKIHYNQYQYATALMILEKLLSDYPEHPEVPRVKYDVAMTHYRMGNYQRSNEKALDWLSEYPENPLMGEIFFLMGRNFNALDDIPRAFFWWLKALENISFDYGFPDRQDDIENRIMGLIERGTVEDLELMTRWAADSIYIPHIHHKIASLYLERNELEKARIAAMALVRSTPEQHWVSIGRTILERIESELSTRSKTIGCLLPLSGPYAIYGQEALNGIQLGMGIFNASENEEDVELIIKDTKGNVDDAISGVEELAIKEKVMAIIGPLASKTAVAAAKRAQELGVPIITLTQKDRITDEGYMVFRNFLTPAKEVKRLLDKAINGMNMRRFAILYPNNPYGQYLMNLFWDGVEQLQGSITAVETYQPDQTDFADEIKKMVGLYYPRPESVIEMLKALKALEDKEDVPSDLDEPDEQKEEEELTEEELVEELTQLPIIDFDAVFIPDNYQRVALIAPQFPFYSIFNIPFLGTSLWQSPELLITAGDYVQGALFPSGFFPENDSNDVREFVRLYQMNFESNPGVLAANGYDTIRFIKNLLNQYTIRTRRDFQLGLTQHNVFYGVTGEISFDLQGEVEKEPIMLTISGKSIRILH